jgi:hypothetical protein
MFYSHVSVARHAGARVAGKMCSSRNSFAASDNWPQCPAGMYQISGSAIEYILKEAREIGYQDLYIPSIGTHKSQAILCNSLTMMVYHKFTYVI